MNKRPWAGLAAFALLALCLSSHAVVRETQVIAAGEGVSRLAVDRVTGRVFTVDTGFGRSTAGSVSVLEPDGTLRLIATAPNPSDLAVDAVSRKVVVTHPGLAIVTLIDADTLAQLTVPTGARPMFAAAMEGSGRAYVIGITDAVDIPIYEMAGYGAGTLTEVDLLAGTSRIFAVQGITPRNLVTDAARGRVYVTGRKFHAVGKFDPSFMLAFDTSAHAFAGMPAEIGAMVGEHLLSASGEEIYVLTHVPKFRPDQDLFFQNSVRPALMVLGAADLALRRTIELPDTEDLMGKGATITASLGYDSVSGTVYVLDKNYSRIYVVDIGAGTFRTVQVEGPANFLAFNAATRNVLVRLPYNGYIGVYSATGERIDTVPGGLAATWGTTPLTGYYDVAYNSATGTAYAASGHDSSLTVLRTTDMPLAQSAVNMTDLWWNPADGGWGVYLEQQGATLFGALFVKDAQGAPRWYVMSNGKRNGNGSFSGALYRTRGPIANALSNVAQVGTLTFSPGTLDTALLSYDIEGAARSTPVTRQVFAAGRQCGWSASIAPKAARGANFTALWYDAAQPGWGLALSQRAETIFGVLYSYDGQDQPTWSVMSNGQPRGEGAFGGALYQVSGSSVLTVGEMSLAFSTSNTANLSYGAEKALTSRSISRQVFAPLVSDCGD